MQQTGHPPRAPQERFYFGDGVLPLFESGIPLLLDRLRALPDKDGVTIAYPDEGAWKRFHYQFKDEGYPEVRPRGGLWLLGYRFTHTA